MSLITADDAYNTIKNKPKEIPKRISRKCLTKIYSLIREAIEDDKYEVVVIYHPVTFFGDDWANHLTMENFQKSRSWTIGKLVRILGYDVVLEDNNLKISWKKGGKATKAASCCCW